MEKTYFWTVEQAIDVDVDDLAQKAIGANATAEDVVDCFINGQEDDVYCTIDDETTAEIVKDVKTAMGKRKPLLDKAEKQYLYSLLKPFKDASIRKIQSSNNYQRIRVTYAYTDSSDEYEYFVLPPFKNDTMYKNLKIGKDYKFKELFPKKR